MTRVAVILAIVALSTAALAACESLDKPVDPVWNKQPCAHCHMLLGERRHAAQLVTRSGERLHFDDVGCLVEAIASDPARVERAWVQNDAGAWVEARNTRYARGAKTPMGYGFIARADGELSFDQLPAQLAQHAPATP